MTDLVLIRNAEVWAPTPLGRRDVLLGAGRVLAMAPQLSPGLATTIIDAAGALLCPGLVDSLVHLSGGGGEGGFATRTLPLASAEEPLRAGVTTMIGALGTDDTTRNHADLLACARSLRIQGVNTYILTGSYQVPPVTLTGSVRQDLIVVPDIIGVGEIAIADHRGSQPTARELARIGADARVGAMLAGKRGTVLIHVGDAADGLHLLHDVSDTSALPVSQWHPTHINRSHALLEHAPAWLARGGSLDLTTSTTPALLASGDLPAASVLAQLLGDGASPAQITMSSDGQASLPLFDDAGGLLDIQAAPIASLFDAMRHAVLQHGVDFEAALTTVTRTPATVWGLGRKGEVRVDADADLLLLEPDSLAVRSTFARGRVHHWV